MLQKWGLLYFFILFFQYNSLAQSKSIDSLKKEPITPDKKGLGVLVQLCWEYRNIQSDTAIKYGKQAIALTQKVDSDSLAAKACMFVGFINAWQGNYAIGLDYCQKALSIAQKAKDLEQIAYALHNIGDIYLQKDEPEQAMGFTHQAIPYFLKINHQRGLSYCYLTMGTSLLKLQKYDTALIVLRRGQMNRKLAKDKNLYSLITEQVGKVYLLKKDVQQAQIQFVDARNLFVELKNYRRLSRLFREMAALKVLLKETDSAFYYAHKSFVLAKDSLHTKAAIKDAAQLLCELYKEQNNYTEAFNYQQITMLYQDSLHNEAQHRQFYAQEQEYKAKQEATEAALLKSENERNYLIQNVLIAGLVLMILLIFLLFKNIRDRQKAAIRLEVKRKQIETQAQSLQQQATSLQQSNQELLVLNEQINQQAELLNEINHTKDKLFAIIGHDLRSPVRNLKSFLELLTDQYITEAELITFLPEFHKNVNVMYDTLENLLQWSKTQLSGLKVEPENCKLYEIVQQHIYLFDRICEGKSIDLQSNIDTNLYVYVDIDHLKLILRNLIGNAVKFTNEHGTIHITAHQENDYVIIEVKDTGIGMTAEQQENLFGITSHFTTYGTKGEKGTGLGLLLCKEFVEKNGGQLTYQSVVNQGTIFIFSLPVGNVTANASNKTSLLAQYS